MALVTRTLRRWWPLWAASALAAILAAGVTASLSRGKGEPPARLSETVLDPAFQADTFRLQDPAGRAVSLEDYRGRVVVLTFLYTHCPDACPLIAERLRSAHARLGEVAARAAFVAVSVDPRGDTPSAIEAFLARHHLQHVLVYLNGPATELQRVWAEYHIRTDVEATQGVTFVGHTAKIYVIDSGGTLRGSLPAEFRAEDLAADVRLLALGGGR